MKSTKIVLAAAALVFSLGAYSQTDSLRTGTSATKMDTTKRHSDLNQSTNSTNLQDHQSTNAQQATIKNNAATTSGSATTTSSMPDVPKPNFGRYYIPVLGNYNAVATSTDNKSLKITPDENNPGKIWVEGLTDNKFYALLKAVPGTYKIPAQKQDDKSVAEGTLIYDENSKQINVCSGCGFNEQTPSATEEVIAVEDTKTDISKNKKHRQPVAKVKKVPVISFVGTKADQGTVSILQ